MIKKNWIWILIAVVTFTVSSYFYASNRAEKVEQVNINLGSSSGIYLVNQERLKEYLYKRMDTLVGQTMEEIDLAWMEYIMEENSYVSLAEIYLDNHHHLNLDIELAQPMIRYLSDDGRGFYISKEGDLIDWSPDFTPRLIVARGNLSKYTPGDTISERLQNQLKILSKVGNEIVSSSYLQSIVDEIILKSENNIEIVSKIGNARVLVGDTVGLADKMNRFKLFYQEAYPIVGWDKYQVIDVRFKEKIYCRK